MSKRYRYKEVAGTMNSLFTRMAFDEVDRTTEHANRILELCRDKLSEADMATLKTLLMGGEVDEGAPIKGVEARRAGAMDSATEADFYRQYPSAKRIGRDPYPGGFR